MDLKHFESETTDAFKQSSLQKEQTNKKSPDKRQTPFSKQISYEPSCFEIYKQKLQEDKESLKNSKNYIPKLHTQPIKTGSLANPFDYYLEKQTVISNDLDAQSQISPIPQWQLEAKTQRINSTMSLTSFVPVSKTCSFYNMNPLSESNLQKTETPLKCNPMAGGVRPEVYFRDQGSLLTRKNC